MRGALLGALEASGDLKGSLPADFADSLALSERSRKVDGNDGLATVAENEHFGTSRQPRSEWDEGRTQAGQVECAKIQGR